MSPSILNSAHDTGEPASNNTGRVRVRHRLRGFDRRPLRRVASLGASGLALFILSFRLVAAESYLATNQVDGIALLPPPPVADSGEQLADLASARLVFNNAGEHERERAEKQATLHIFKFAPAIGDFLQPRKFPKVERLLERSKASVREPLNTAKEYWKRKRPYEADANLKYGKAEASFSYPSGHSTVGTVQALVLAELFPEQRDAILEAGRQIGWDRVVIGKHYPTDIYAGRTLGQAIVRELKVNTEFQRDFAEAKSEVGTARASLNSGK